MELLFLVKDFGISNITILVIFVCMEKDSKSVSGNVIIIIRVLTVYVEIFQRRSLGGDRISCCWKCP